MTTIKAEEAGRLVDSIMQATDDYLAIAEYAAPNNSRTYLANIEEQEGGGINITILDTYSQGFTLCLKSDGTFTQYPTGG